MRIFCGAQIVITLFFINRGKSSLLNALLDEANVLPTSGSRGCTAAVVELTYNTAMVGGDARSDDGSIGTDGTMEVPVYKGVVEFMTLSDWHKELKILVEERSTQEKTIYAIPPMEDNMPAAAAAWQKMYVQHFLLLGTKTIDVSLFVFLTCKTIFIS